MRLLKLFSLVPTVTTDVSSGRYGEFSYSATCDAYFQELFRSDESVEFQVPLKIFVELTQLDVVISVPGPLSTAVNE